MTLRIMLVGLVASLGYEPPSGSDVSCWAQAGVAWVQAQRLDRSGTVYELKLDLTEPSDRQQVVEKLEVPALDCDCGQEVARDAAFMAVTDGIAADLSADLLASQREEALSDQLETKLAREVPAPVGLPAGEEVGCLIVPVDETRTAEVEWTEEDKLADPAEPTVESHARPDRVSSAVRLTREALEAWAALMQETVEECHSAR
jgi:hypothetical protein